LPQTKARCSSHGLNSSWVACAGIGLALYPILKKYNEGLAIGSAGFRVIEGALDVVGALLYTVLLALSQEFVKAGAPASSYFQTADVLINAGTGWLTNMAMLLTFGIGALMYYVVLSISLVPLAQFGSVNHRTIISALLVMFHVIPPSVPYSQSADIPAGDGLGGLADR
jgi:hypothetical protein